MNVQGTWKVVVKHPDGRKTLEEHKGSQNGLARHLADLLVLYPQAGFDIDPVYARLVP